jgi:hypothetical protein
MRWTVLFALAVAGLGCQSLSRCRHRCEPAGTLVYSPAAPAAAGTRGGGPAPRQPARLTVTETVVPPSDPAGLTPISYPAPPPPPPGMMAAHVETTATYKHHCHLGLDYLQIRLPFPHLRIFTGPDKVVTQTEYSPAPALVPAPSQLYLAPSPPVLGPHAVSPPARLPSPHPTARSEFVLPPIRR